MKSIKKLKKYGTAVAGTALLVGATLTGAAAQTGGSSGTSLGDYPGPFVDDDGTIQSSIVVGEDAATADVVGAIDIAGSLSQAAFTTESAEGGSGPATAVNGVTEEADIRGNTAGELTAFDYETFMAGQMEDEDGNPHFVTESANFDATSVVNGTEAQAQVDGADLDYQVQYDPGFQANDTISLLGEDYEVTAVSNGEVSLGSTVTNSELGLDETYSHGPYTVKVEDFNQNDNTVLVQISKDGESLTMEGVETGESVSVDDGDFVVDADSIYFGSQDNYITLSSTYTDTVLEDGSAAPMDEDYDVTLGVSDGDTLDSITLDNTVSTASEADEENNVVQNLDEGETLAGPAGYFDFVNAGLTSAQMTDVDFQTEQRVSFTTPKGTSLTVPMDDVVDQSADGDTTDADNVNLTDLSEGDWVPIQTAEDEGDGTNDVYVVEVDTVDAENGEVVFSHGDYDWTIPYGEETTRGAPGFQLDVNPDGNLTNVAATPVTTTQYGANLTTVDDYGTNVTVLEEGTGDSDTGDGAHTVEVVYEDSDDSFFSDADAGEIGSVNVTAPGVSLDLDDTGSTLTNFGSVANLRSATSAEIDYASSQRSAQFGLGEATESSGEEDGTTQTPAYGDTFPSVGALDTDESIGQVKENDNVILVGGPAINDLTAELATENQTWDADEWQTGGHEGTSLLQLTEGFDGEGGNKALVVAGHAAEDTRTAAEYLSNYGDHSDALSGESNVTISTETGNVVE